MAHSAGKQEPVSKPLELRIYPQTCTCTVDNEGCTFIPMDCLMHGVQVADWGGQKKKRLTDAELAAEYWAPIFIHFPDPTVWDRDFAGTSAEMSRRSATLHRFATTPHYFEADQ